MLNKVCDEAAYNFHHDTEILYKLDCQGQCREVASLGYTHISYFHIDCK